MVHTSSQICARVMLFGQKGDRKMYLIWKTFEFSPRNLDRQRCLEWTNYVAWFEGYFSNCGRRDFWISVRFRTNVMCNILELNETGFRNRIYKELAKDLVSLASLLRSRRRVIGSNYPRYTGHPECFRVFLGVYCCVPWSVFRYHCWVPGC
jgi:hypothetical protein